MAEIPDPRVSVMSIPWKPVEIMRYLNSRDLSADPNIKISTFGHVEKGELTDQYTIQIQLESVELSPNEFLRVDVYGAYHAIPEGLVLIRHDPEDFIVSEGMYVIKVQMVRVDITASAIKMHVITPEEVQIVGISRNRF